MLLVKPIYMNQQAKKHHHPHQVHDKHTTNSSGHLSLDGGNNGIEKVKLLNKADQLE